MASLVLNSSFYPDLNDFNSNLNRPECWGEYSQPGGQLGGNCDQQFRRFRNNFRACHELEGYRQQKAEDYFLPKPLSYDFRSHITSDQNTKRRIKPPFSVHVLPSHDYNRIDKSGEFILSSNTKEALCDLHTGLYRTSRYSKMYPDYTPRIIAYPGNLPPQHQHHEYLNNMLVRNHLYDHQIMLPPFERFELVSHGERLLPSIERKSNSGCSEVLEFDKYAPFKDLRESVRSEQKEKRKISQMHYKTLKLPTKSYRRQHRVRFNVSGTTKSSSVPMKFGPSIQQRSVRDRLENSIRQGICAEQLPTLDVDSRLISCVKKNEEMERHCQSPPREFMCHHLEMLRRKRLEADTADDKEDKESSLPNPHVDLEEDEEENQKNRAFECQLLAYNNQLGLPYDCNRFSLIHKAGKFVSPWESNLDPDYLCSKSDSSKRYHSLFPDVVPDLRENFIYGKRVNFFGFNSSAFRG